MSKLSSTILVTVQFICIGYFLFIGNVLHLKVIPIVFFLLSLIIIVLAILTMQIGNVSVFPEPKIGVKLKTNGIYKIIRHPMYTSVLLFCLSLVLNNFSFLGCAIFILLVVVLLIKIFREEKYLSKLFPEYIQYMQLTKRLIPFIW